MNKKTLTIDGTENITHYSWGSTLFEKGGKVYFTDSVGEFIEHAPFEAPCAEVNPEDLNELHVDFWAYREDGTPTIDRYLGYIR